MDALGIGSSDHGVDIRLGWRLTDSFVHLQAGGDHVHLYLLLLLSLISFFHFNIYL